MNGSQRLLERDTLVDSIMRRTLRAPPLVTGAQHVLVARNLLGKLVECALDGGGRTGSILLYRQLSGGQTQIEADVSPFARRILLHNRFQMDEFRTKYAKALAQCFDLVVDFLFEVGSLLDSVADVDIHESLERGRRSREASVPKTRLYTRR